jgi:hypothetical protein
MTDEINQREGTTTMKLTTNTNVSVDGVMQGAYTAQRALEVGGLRYC